MKREQIDSATRAIGILLAAAASISILAAAPAWSEDMPGEGKTVRPLLADDLESRFAMEIVDIGLEELGYDVEGIKQVQVQAGYVAVAQGDASVWGSMWEPNHDKYLEKAGADKMSKVGVLVDGAVSGYLIDKKTAEEHGITNIGQLKDPELAKLFDSDGDGMANLAGCPTGWGCDPIINHHIKEYGLSDTVEHEQGEFVITHTDAIARFKAGEPVLYYTYTPLWLNQLLVPGKEVEWLEVPFATFPAGREVVSSTSLPDGRNIGFELLRIRLVANNDFLAENPAAKKWFELVSVPIEDVNAENFLIYEGDDSLEQIRGHAEEWVKNHRDQFDAWLAEARAATD
jgi:glycine betaine/proline transport system substrate-binding protein